MRRLECAVRRQAAEKLQSLNRYSYAFNNPLLLSDPEGLFPGKGALKKAAKVVSNNTAAIHTALDVAGFVPVVGDFADAVNAVIYLAEGDYENAALSGLAIIPIAGDAATGARLAMKVADDAAALGKAIKPIGKLDELADSAKAPEATGFFGRSLDDLSAAAAAPKKGDLTAAGHALTKHADGQRPSSGAFPALRGGPTEINELAQYQMDDILTYPGSQFMQKSHSRFGNVLDVVAPDGRGIRFNSDGRFVGFLEP